MAHVLLTDKEEQRQRTSQARDRERTTQATPLSGVAQSSPAPSRAQEALLASLQKQWGVRSLDRTLYKLPSQR